MTEPQASPVIALAISILPSSSSIKQCSQSIRFVCYHQSNSAVLLFRTLQLYCTEKHLQFHYISHKKLRISRLNNMNNQTMKLSIKGLESYDTSKMFRCIDNTCAAQLFAIHAHILTTQRCCHRIRDKCSINNHLNIN